MTQWIELAVSVLVPIVSAVVIYLAARIERAIYQYVQNEQTRTLLVRLNDAVFDAVSEVEQTTVAALREAAADGKITREEAAGIRDLALAKAREYLGERGINSARDVLGKDEEALERLIVARIERAVVDLKK